MENRELQERESRPPGRLAEVLGHPMSGCSLRSLGRIMASYHGAPGRALVRDVARLGGASAMLLPFRIHNRLRFARAVERTPITRAPIFIIGHWRSGTTLLEHLLACDEQFGFATYFANQFPYMAASIQEKGSFLNRRFSAMAIKRPQDNVVFSIDTPSEEEFAIAKMSRYSFIHAWVFRDRWQDIADKYLTMERIDPDELRQWQDIYTRIARTWTYIHQGKRLVFKSPYNTARLGHVLRVFPDSKFIHIHRRPAEAIVSTLDMMHKFSRFALRHISDDGLIAQVARTYETVARAYAAGKQEVATTRLVELGFEELLADPLAALQKIYSTLDLGLDERTLDNARRFIAARAGYRRNRYDVQPEIAAAIAEAASLGRQVYGYNEPPDR